VVCVYVYNFKIFNFLIGQFTNDFRGLKSDSWPSSAIEIDSPNQPLV